MSQAGGRRTAEVTDVVELGPFQFRWPDSTEHFERGWDATVKVEGTRHRLRHGIGGRVVYGRERVHTVTWLDGDVQVEGVEADDYPVTRGLLSTLRRPDKKHVRRPDEIPGGYEDLEIVEHRREIDAPWSPYTLAVKIVEDDLAAWATHACLRQRQRPGAAWGRQPPRTSDQQLTGMLRSRRRGPCSERRW